MVDMYGRWTEEKDYSVYPKEKWCDMDYVAAWIRSTEYKPETSMEHLIDMILWGYVSQLADDNTEFYTDITESENENMVSIIDLSCFVNDSGGLKEFDYWC